MSAAAPGSADAAPLIRALRSAVSTSSGAANRPGQLRTQMVNALGPEDAERFRREVHQLVAAAEEHLPANLTRLGPLTDDTVDRLAGELAAGRGWSVDVGQRITRIWAAALGFDEFAVDSLPMPPGRPDAPARPPAFAVASSDRTAAPPFPVPSLPGPYPPGPQVPPVPSQPHAPPVRPMHGPVPLSERPLASCRAYTGLPLLLVAGLVSAVAVALVVVAVTVTAGLISVLLVAVISVPLAAVVVGWALLLAAAVRRGVLTSFVGGVQFTPYDVWARRPKTSESVFVPWDSTAITTGFVSTAWLGEHRIEIGPRNRVFAVTLAHAQFSAGHS